MFLEITLILIILVISYICYNLFKKNELYEDTIELYDNWFSVFDVSVKDTEQKLKEIDNKGTFESYDEVGFFFDYLKKLNKGLSDLFDETKKGENKDE